MTELQFFNYILYFIILSD